MNKHIHRLKAETKSEWQKVAAIRHEEDKMLLEDIYEDLDLAAPLLSTEINIRQKEIINHSLKQNYKEDEIDCCDDIEEEVTEVNEITTETASEVEFSELINTDITTETINGRGLTHEEGSASNNEEISLQERVTEVTNNINDTSKISQKPNGALIINDNQEACPAPQTPDKETIIRDENESSMEEQTSETKLIDHFDETDPRSPSPRRKDKVPQKSLEEKIRKVSKSPSTSSNDSSNKNSDKTLVFKETSLHNYNVNTTSPKSKSPEIRMGGNSFNTDGSINDETTQNKEITQTNETNLSRISQENGAQSNSPEDTYIGTSSNKDMNSGSTCPNEAIGESGIASNIDMSQTTLQLNNESRMENVSREKEIDLKLSLSTVETPELESTGKQNDQPNTEPCEPIVKSDFKLATDKNTDVANVDEEIKKIIEVECEVPNPSSFMEDESLEAHIKCCNDGQFISQNTIDKKGNVDNVDETAVKELVDLDKNAPQYLETIPSKIGQAPWCNSPNEVVQEVAGAFNNHLEYNENNHNKYPKTLNLSRCITEPLIRDQSNLKIFASKSNTNLKFIKHTNDESNMVRSKMIVNRSHKPLIRSLSASSEAGSFVERSVDNLSDMIEHYQKPYNSESDISYSPAFSDEVIRLQTGSDASYSPSFSDEIIRLQTGTFLSSYDNIYESPFSKKDKSKKEIIPFGINNTETTTIDLNNTATNNDKSIQASSDVVDKKQGVDRFPKRFYQSLPKDFCRSGIQKPPLKVRFSLGEISEQEEDRQSDFQKIGVSKTPMRIPKKTVSCLKTAKFRDLNNNENDIHYSNPFLTWGTPNRNRLQAELNLHKPNIKGPNANLIRSISTEINSSLISFEQKSPLRRSASYSVNMTRRNSDESIVAKRMILEEFSKMKNGNKSESMVSLV